MRTRKRSAKNGEIRKAELIPITDASGQIVMVPLPGGLNDLAKRLRKWKNAAKSLSGDKIFVASGDNLLKIIEAHGITGRTKGGGPQGTGERSGSAMLDVLDKLSKPGKSLPGQNLTALKKLEELMKEVDGSESNLNPQNVMFSNPTDFNDAGITIDTEPVYGHYVTPEYVDRIDTRADALGDQFEGRNWGKPAPSSWYETGEGGKGKAKPPMWQAIYGDGTGDGTFKGESLYTIVKDLRESWSKSTGAGGGIPKQNRIKIQSTAGKGSWQKAIKLDGVEDIANEIIDDIKSQKRQSKYVRRSGTLNWSEVASEFERNPIPTDGESDEAQELAGLRENIELDFIWISFPARKQVNRLMFHFMKKANLVLDNDLPKLGTGADTLYLFVSLKQERAQQASRQRAEEYRQKKDGERNMKKSWEEILKC